MSKHSILVGLSFGLTSGVITTLGLMVGVSSAAGSRVAVIGAILTIAVADAFSDALGIHISEESENRHSAKEIWIATISTFLSKFFFALTFIVPVFLFSLENAILISVIWGLSILSAMSYILAKQQHISPWQVISEHLIIALVVIFSTHYIGLWISQAFSS